MVLRFLKSVGFGAVVLFLTLPYFALAGAIYWGASWLPWPEALWQNGIAGGVIAVLTLVPLVLAAFRIDRCAARLSGLVEEEHVTFLFMPTRYWLAGFAVAIAPVIAVLVIRVLGLNRAGVDYLMQSLGDLQQSEVAVNHFDLITTAALFIYFLAYGVISVRKSVHERDPPSLFSAWASTLLFTAPFLAIAKVVTLALLDLLTLVPVESFVVTRDLTLAHALAIQLTILWCLYATNSALVLRAKLVRILADIETQRMLPE